MKKRNNVLKWIVVLTVVGALIGVGAVVLPKQSTSVSAQTTGATSTPVPSYTQDYTVKRGDISANISPTGEVYAPHQTSLYFDANSIALVAVNAKVGQVVQAGAVLAKIETSTLQGAVDKANASLLSAEDDLNTAKNPYTDIDKRQAEAAVAQAKSSLEAARKKLADLQAPDLATAQTNLQNAQENLPVTQDKLAALKADTTIQANIDNLQWKANEAEAYHGQQLKNASTPNPSEEQLDYELLTRNQMLDAQEALQRAQLQAQSDRMKAEHDVVAAADTLADAKKALADLQAGATDQLALAQAQNAVSQAEYDVKNAQSSLDTILAGADPEKVKLAQAKYDAAQGSYDKAKAALDGATMVAPFAGTVIAVNGEVGDLVSPSRAVVTLADLTELRVHASVDETQIANVQVGQQVQVTFDALPGKRLPGQVLEVPLEGTLSNNVVTYQVDISLQNAADAALKPGMTASLQISIGSKKNAILVPSLAIIQNAEGIFVTLKESSGVTSTVPIQIGLRSGTNVEVVRGLNEGDTVVLTYKAATTTTNRQGQQGGPPDVVFREAPAGSSSGSNTQRSGQ